ncbi:MAG TPA: glycosyltransferase family A protein [Pyrinomonadaceae bacterium]|nr:glycosyltransferase family A protein [Pyrinomonadaceae bacterium]
MITPSANARTVEHAEPFVSVIIPAYKVAPFIHATLGSVLAQTFDNFEIIVINDGSPDTEALEREIAPYTHLITYIRQPNQGAGAARNSGIQVARGEFIAFLDGDDLWLPHFLEQQLALLIAKGGFDLVYADAVNLRGTQLSKVTNMDVNPSTGAVTAESLIAGTCNVITSSVVVRRQLLLDVGLFDERFPNSQDFDLWLRLAKHGVRIGYQQKVLVHRRIYEGSLASNPIKSFEGEISVLEKTKLRGDLTAAEASAIDRTIELRRANIEVVRGKQQLSAGDFDSALATFTVANNFYQSWKLRFVVLSLRLAPRLLQRVYSLRAT